MLLFTLGSARAGFPGISLATARLIVSVFFWEAELKASHALCTNNRKGKQAKYPVRNWFEVCVCSQGVRELLILGFLIKAVKINHQESTTLWPFRGYSAGYMFLVPGELCTTLHAAGRCRRGQAGRQRRQMIGIGPVDMSAFWRRHPQRNVLG